MKKFRINKIRVIMFLFMILIFTTGLNIKTFSKDEVYKKEVKIIHHFVNTNETIWDIADIYNNGMDKRMYVNQIIELNNNTTKIIQGQVLSIPVY